jgi:hypothetical protein
MLYLFASISAEALDRIIKEAILRGVRKEIDQGQ